MHSGFYTIASGILTQQNELDTIANNLANLQTPGYRASRLVTGAFEAEVQKRIDANGQQVLGDGVAYPISVVQGEVACRNSGLLEPTGRELDFALNGDAYFNIQGQDGTTYLTRNGQFTVDDQGYLTLPNIGRVLGKNGPLQVGQDGITIDELGNVYNKQGQQVGALQLTRPADNTTMTKMGNGMFTAPQGAVNADNYQVVQFTLEKSNVDMNQEMSNFIAAQRAFQSCSSALQIIDGIDRKAVAQIGAVQ